MSVTSQPTSAEHHMRVLVLRSLQNSDDHIKSSALPELLHQLQFHPLPSLHYLRVKCGIEGDVSGLTAFLPQCTNIRTLHHVRYQPVSESVEEEMWEAAVRGCKNLEEVRVSGEYSDVACNRLVSVLRRLSKKKGIQQALELKRIMGVDWETGRAKGYTEQLKHLLPALQ